LQSVKGQGGRDQWRSQQLTRPEVAVLYCCRKFTTSGRQGIRSTERHAEIRAKPCSHRSRQGTGQVCPAPGEGTIPSTTCHPHLARCTAGKDHDTRCNSARSLRICLDSRPRFTGPPQLHAQRITKRTPELIQWWRVCNQPRLHEFVRSNCSISIAENLTKPYS